MGKGSRLRAARSAAKKTISERDVLKEARREINSQLSAHTDRFFRDETSVILWVLHEVFGMGHGRLKRFYDRYADENKKLKEYYTMTDSDMPYMTKRLLKDIGVDLDEWAKE